MWISQIINKIFTERPVIWIIFFVSLIDKPSENFSNIFRSSQVFDVIKYYRWKQNRDKSLAIGFFVGGVADLDILSFCRFFDLFYFFWRVFWVEEVTMDFLKRNSKVHDWRFGFLMERLLKINVSGKRRSRNKDDSFI